MVSKVKEGKLKVGFTEPVKFLPESTVGIQKFHTGGWGNVDVSGVVDKVLLGVIFMNDVTQFISEKLESQLQCKEKAERWIAYWIVECISKALRACTPRAGEIYVLSSKIKEWLEW